MPLEMYFNELSTQNKAFTKIEARDRASNLINTILEATLRGVKRVLHVPEDFDSVPLANGYYWKDWRQDNRVNKDMRTFFRRLATKKPFLADDSTQQSIYQQIDCYFMDEKACGLKAAYIADGLAVSLLSENKWDCETCGIEVQEIEDENVLCSTSVVHHASMQEHIIKQSEWFEARLREDFNNGKELWELINGQLNHLIFCSDTEKQICSLPAEFLLQTFRFLIALNRYCVDKKGEPFDPKKVDYDVTPESPTTLQLYGGERTFLCPDNVTRKFSWHAKKGKLRIYFDFEYRQGYVLIGYVGKHLRTSKFR